MILSDKTIQKMIDNKSLEISPLGNNQIQPASVDIRLGNTYSVIEDSSNGIIRLGSAIQYKTIQTDRYLLCRDNLFLQQHWNISSCRII